MKIAANKELNERLEDTEHDYHLYIKIWAVIFILTAITALVPNIRGLWLVFTTLLIGYTFLCLINLIEFKFCALALRINGKK